MLEIFGIIALCKLNRQNAIARGRRPGGFVALTIILWVGLEFIGMVAGFILLGDKSEYLPYAVALPCAGLGALISFLCAKFGPRGNYVAPTTQMQSTNGGATPVYASNPNMPAYAQQPVQMPGQPIQQPAQPQEFVHVENPYQAPAAYQAPAVDNSVVGTPVAAQPVATAPVRYCEFCGAQLKPGAKFCATCGAQVPQQ